MLITPLWAASSSRFSETPVGHGLNLALEINLLPGLYNSRWGGIPRLPLVVRSPQGCQRLLDAVQSGKASLLFGRMEHGFNHSPSLKIKA